MKFAAYAKTINKIISREKKMKSKRRSDSAIEVHLFLCN